ncbi:MAG: L-serine ammonia-lyase, iron-sulfur-dependent subunit beta [Coriobacteriia bacterium]
MGAPRSLFDILGPVMIGPSSSHTAGAVRLGLLARAIFGRQPEDVKVVMHGSFASTGTGHGTDLALVAGLLGMRPDDPEMVRSLERARREGMSIEIVNGDLGDVHPNSVLLHLRAGDSELSVQGASTGGGEVLVTRIGEFEAQASGSMPLLVVTNTDSPGEIAAVTRLISESGANIAEMRVARTRKGAEALMLIETDTLLADDALQAIAGLPGVLAVRAVPPV